jgi:predicted phosphodiesterase
LQRRIVQLACAGWFKEDLAVRIAALSDIHGNLFALDAVLADVGTRSIDVTVNLGDLLSGGLQPRATGDRLLALGLPTVRGNHERQLLTKPPMQMSASDRLAHNTVRPEHLEWLASLPLTLEVADGVLAFHGSPSDDLTYLLDTVDETGARAATPQEVLQRLGEQSSWPLLLCGHTHLQRTLRLPTGALVVNPGSVGWPAYSDDEPYPHVMEAGTPHARYAVVENTGERWEHTFHAVEYDWEQAAMLAEQNTRPDVARALRTGRV